MSESNKTLPPTEKRIKKAEEEGNFCFSDAVVHIATLLVGVLVCFVALADIPQRFDRGLYWAIQMGNRSDFNGALQNELSVLMREMLPITAIIFGATALSAILANVVQVGMVFQGAKFKKGPEAVNPVNNLKNLFSMHTLSNFVSQLLKVAIVCFICYKIIKDDKTLVDRIYAHGLDTLGGMSEAATTVGKILVISLLCLIPVGVFDYWIKKKLYIKDNMMSHDEVEREHKESEGDPHMKSHRKAVGRELIESHGHQRLPNASAVIRNPTHVAVAVRFEPKVAPVPYVIDMVTGEDALRMIKEAQEIGVPLYENIPLARGILANGAVNQHIPLELSEMVVPFIYWLQNNHPDRIFHQPEFDASLTRIGDVRR